MSAVYVTYSSYAEPPAGIKVGRSYQFGKDKTGYYLSDVYKNHYMDIFIIKALFTPIDKTWGEVFNTKKLTENKINSPII